jgi:uncharacterized membrane protein SpoIIM required for sporulation
MKGDHSIEPRSVAFRKKRERGWQELESMVEQVEKKGLSSLSEEDLHQLPVRYRETLFSLSVARATALDRAMIQYLEALSARAYLAVYGSRRPARQVLNIFFERIPQAVRAHAGEFWLAFFLVALGTALAWALTSMDPNWFNTFVDARLANGRHPWATTEELRKTLYSSPPMKEMLSAFASYLFAHNTRIGILAFALGFLAGVPTALLLFTNGLMLGAFLSIFHRHGLLWEAVGWLFVHGVPEFAAILLSGAAGFVMARAILSPGRHTRLGALKTAGPAASFIMMGAIFLFFVAALFEGFFRQLVQDDMVRYLFIAINLLWLVLWLAFVGRRSKSNHEFTQPAH